MGTESRIDIIITTIKKGLGDKETQKTLKDLKSGFQQVTGISLGWAGAIGAGAAALKKLSDTAKQGVDAVVSISNTTDGFRRITGESAESLSRFIQVADDALINVDSLQTAMQRAANQGFDVSTTSIMRMSDEYLKLAPGIERNTYVSKIFGRQSGEITKILEMGSTAIRDRMDAVNESITVDDAAVDAAIEYQQALDDMNDTVLALKMELGKGLIPEFTRFAKDLSNFPTWFTKQDDPRNPIGAIGVSGGMSKEKIAQLREELSRMERATAAAEVGSDRFDKMANNIKSATDAAEENLDVMDRYKNVTSLAGDLQSSEEKLLKAEQDLSEYQSSHPMDRKGIAERKQAVDDLKTAQQDMVNQWMVNVYTQLLTADGDLSQSDMDFLLKFQVNTGLLSQENADRAMSYWDYANRVLAANDLIQSSIDELHGKDLTVHTIYESLPSSTSNPIVAAQIATGVAGGSVAPRAAGGPVWPGLVAMVGEQGPEQVVFGAYGTVIPTGQNARGDIYISINGAGDSRAVANEVMRQLRLQGIAR